MVIEPSTGKITFKSGMILESGATRGEFLKSPEGLVAKVHVKNEPWCSFRFEVQEEPVVFAVFFNGEILESLHLSVSDPAFGSSWNDWSEEKEMERKRANDRWLALKGLSPGQQYSWGTVWSGYDSKGGSSSAVIRYNRSKHVIQPGRAQRRRAPVNSTLTVMQITSAARSDLLQAVDCLAAAFAEDPITSFLLEAGPNYQGRLAQFFSLLMRARIALNMPVLVARDPVGIHGVAMGYAAVRPAWPNAIIEEWDHFEKDIPGLPERMAVYDEIAEKCKPPKPHYYLGVIGMDPKLHGLGHGMRLLESFCSLSAADPLSSGVYLETANPSNVRFYERAGFSEIGRGSLGSATLWCMFLEHGLRPDV